MAADVIKAVMMHVPVQPPPQAVLVDKDGRYAATVVGPSSNDWTHLTDVRGAKGTEDRGAAVPQAAWRLPAHGQLQGTTPAAATLCPEI